MSIQASDVFRIAKHAHESVSDSKWDAQSGDFHRVMCAITSVAIHSALDLGIVTLPASPSELPEATKPPTTHSNP